MVVLLPTTSQRGTKAAWAVACTRILGSSKQRLTWSLSRLLLRCSGRCSGRCVCVVWWSRSTASGELGEGCSGALPLRLPLRRASFTPRRHLVVAPEDTTSHNASSSLASDHLNLSFVNSPQSAVSTRGGVVGGAAPPWLLGLCVFLFSRVGLPLPLTGTARNSTLLEKWTLLRGFCAPAPPHFLLSIPLCTPPQHPALGHSLLFLLLLRPQSPPDACTVLRMEHAWSGYLLGFLFPTLSYILTSLCSALPGPTRPAPSGASPFQCLASELCRLQHC